jgi:hypothetical protein
MERVLRMLEKERDRRSPEDFREFVGALIKTGKAQGGQEEVFWCAFEDQYSPPTGWREEWERGPWDRNDEAVQWLRKRPESVKKLALQFPPSCLVKAKVRLRCPAPGHVAIVTTYIEPGRSRPEGAVTVRSHPEGGIRYECSPDQLEVVGYHKGLTPEVLAMLLMEK